MQLNKRNLLLGFLLSLVCLPGLSRAGSDKPLSARVGDRVRIDVDTVYTKKAMLFIPYDHKETVHYTGTLTSIDHSEVTIAEDTLDRMTRKIPSSKIKQMFVSTGQKRCTLEGAGIGTGCVGIFALGALLADDAEVINDTLISPGRSPEDRLAIAGIILASGTAIGALIGYFVKSDRWEKVTDQQWSFDINVDMRKNRFNFGLSLAFW